MSFLHTRTLYVCRQTDLKEYEECDRVARINSNIGIAGAKSEETKNATAIAKEVSAPTGVHRPEQTPPNGQMADQEKQSERLGILQKWFQVLEKVKGRLASTAQLSPKMERGN